MANNEKVPQLRFPNFDSSWNLKSGGELFSNRREKGRKGVPIYSVSLGKGLVPRSSIDKRMKDDAATEKNCLVKSGDISYNTMRMWQGAFGLSDLECMVSPAYTVLAPKSEVVSGFYQYVLKNHKYLHALWAYSHGLTSDRLRLYYKDFASIKLPHCEEAEQLEVFSFISAVDKKSILLNKKKEQLIQYKKGIMQQIFSQQLRFKDDDGQDFSDWRVRSMSEVLDQVIRELPKPSEKYLALGVRSHMRGTFQKQDFDPEDIAMEKLYLVKENDLIVNITFAWEGAIAIVKKEDEGGLVSHRFPTYVLKKGETTHRYFKYIIQEKRFKYLLDLISPGGAGRNRVLSKNEFLKLKWNLPGIDEQNKIANFLDCIDQKINLAQQQIEKTQAYKQGLLQQMFV